MRFFSYGTLLDPEYQRELFGRVLPTSAARLDGWQAVFTESGYLTIVPRAGASVDGALVEAGERELAICDAWEDVPLYTRVDVTVETGEGLVPTWAYVRRVDGGEPAPPGVLSRAARVEVVRAIRRFVAGEASGHTGA